MNTATSTGPSRFPPKPGPSGADPRTGPAGPDPQVGYFGPDRSLFGWFHAARHPRRDLGIVVCPPVGHEGVQAYRSMRHLAQRLAASGFPTLRFDYHGTGDSDGTDRDLNRVEAWRSSVVTARAHLAEVSGAERIALVGTRLGATLAWLAAAECDVDGLVLWEPCVTGADYLAEMKALSSASRLVRREAAGTAGKDPRTLEAAGFMLHAETCDTLGELAMSSVGPRGTPPVLVIGRSDRNEDRRAADLAEGLGLEVQYDRLPGLKEMLVPPATSVVPEAVWTRVAAWLTAGSTEMPSDGAVESAPNRSVTETVQVTAGVRTVERAVRFGPGGRLFGVVTKPMDSAPRSGVLLLPGGAATRIASNRMYVDAARRLARAGFTVLRMDAQGIGDSWTVDGPENEAYPSGLADDVGVAVQFMRTEYACDGFQLVGLCSGAYAGFTAARRDLTVHGLVMINPMVFYQATGAEQVTPSGHHFARVAYYRRNLFNITAWWRAVGKLMRRRPTVARVRARLKRLVSVVRPGLYADRAADLGADLERLVTAQVDTTFVFSGGDPGIDVTVLHGGSALRRLRRDGRIAWRVFEGTDHTFNQRGPRRAFLDWLTAHCKRVACERDVASRAAEDQRQSAAAGAGPTGSVQPDAAA